MSNSHRPSRLRRQGRNDFDPNVDPMEVIPFDPKSYYYESDLENWLDGWKEAKTEQTARDSYKSSAIFWMRCPHNHIEFTLAQRPNFCPSCGQAIETEGHECDER